MTAVTASAGIYEHFLDLLGRADGGLPPGADARHGAARARYGEALTTLRRSRPAGHDSVGELLAKVAKSIEPEFLGGLDHHRFGNVGIL